MRWRCIRHTDTRAPSCPAESYTARQCFCSRSRPSNRSSRGIVCFCFYLRPLCDHSICARRRKRYTLAKFVERLANVFGLDHSFYMRWNFWSVITPKSREDQDRGAAYCRGVTYSYPHERWLVLSYGEGSKWKIKGWETFLRGLHSLPKERFKAPWYDTWPHPPQPVSKFGGAIMPRVYH